MVTSFIMSFYAKYIFAMRNAVGGIVLSSHDGSEEYGRCSWKGNRRLVADDLEASCQHF